MSIFLQIPIVFAYFHKDTTQLMSYLTLNRGANKTWFINKSKNKYLSFLRTVCFVLWLSSEEAAQFKTVFGKIHQGLEHISCLWDENAPVTHEERQGVLYLPRTGLTLNPTTYG